MSHPIDAVSAGPMGSAASTWPVVRRLRRWYLDDGHLGLSWAVASALGGGVGALVLDLNPGLPILACLVLSIMQGVAVWRRPDGGLWAIGTLIGALLFRWAWWLGALAGFVGESLWKTATSSWTGILDALRWAPIVFVMAMATVDTRPALGDVPLRAGQVVQVTWLSVMVNGLGFAAAGGLLGAAQLYLVMDVPRGAARRWVAASAIGGILIAPVFMADWATWWVFSPVSAPGWLVGALGGLGYGLITGPLLGDVLEQAPDRRPIGHIGASRHPGPLATDQR